VLLNPFIERRFHRRSFKWFTEDRKMNAETKPDLILAVKKFLTVLDELQSMTVAERIITGRSDAALRKSSNEAVAEMRAALEAAHEQEVNAALIVHAVNSLPALVKALEECLWCLEARERMANQEWDGAATDTSAIGMARAALASHKTGG
jgi:hypothetical protein